MLESMSWEGVFFSVKDYIQPVLAAMVIGWFAAKGSLFEEKTSTAITIGTTYTVLFLLSGIASRSAHRFALSFGGENRAAIRLWQMNFLCFAILGLFAWLEQLWVVVVMFVVMNVLQNIWRPILISRIDELTEARSGATILSIESQAQRIATLVVAPLVGWWIDWVTADGASQQFWPIGLVGGLAALVMLSTGRVGGSSDRRAGKRVEANGCSLD